MCLTAEEILNIMLNGLGENIPVVLTLSKENNKSWIGIEYKVRLPKRGCRRRSEEVRVKSMDYLEKLDRHFREMTGKTALRDMGREISYGELGIISGRIYSYLRAMNIGREDIVLINLPRGAAVVCAMVGVLRSGGAFIVMDASDPEERIKYVFHESGSKLLLTQDVYAEMMNVQPAEGYENRDPHDLAYIIYTSGTTGYPKGVMQEYGVLDEIVKSHLALGYRQAGDERMGFVSSFTFTASICWLFASMYAGAVSCIIPLGIVKNTKSLPGYIEKEKISTMFITPSLFGVLKHWPDTLKWVIVGGEPCCRIYCEAPELVNGYAQSETGFIISSGRIDRSYERAPAGRNRMGKNIMILDDEDRPVRQGEKGEICIEAPFFRGYLKHPELTAGTKRGGVLHTGDIGRVTPEGELLVLGRNDDMVKINGNRMDLSEIEDVAKRVAGLTWAGARAFVTDRSSFVCLYYVEELKITGRDLRMEMARWLPGYMIPSRFMKLDSIPKNANGKFSRKLLPFPPAPDADLEEPCTKTERIICEAVASVLGYGAVGVNTDFYDSGGDSIGTIKLVGMLPWKDFTVVHVYKGRTPRGMAKIYESIRDSGEIYPDMMEEEAEKLSFPLTDKQLYYFDYQLYTPMSTMLNLPIMMRFLNAVDMDRLTLALKTVIKAHPVFMTMFYFTEEGVIQHYVPYEPEIEVEKLSEAEMVDVMGDLVRPYKIINDYLYRMRLFQTEHWAYLFFDLHHCISDGTSTRHLIRDIQRAYQGLPLQKDLYYAYLNRIGTDAPDRKEEYENYKELLHEAKWCSRLEFDNNSRSNSLGTVSADVPIASESFEMLADRYGIGKNPFIIAATIMAMAAATGNRNIFITWTHNGRVGEIEKSLVGLVIEDRPLGISITDDMTLSDFLKTIRRKIEACSSYQSNIMITDAEQIVQDDNICVIEQSDILDFAVKGALEYQLVELPNHYEATENVMNVEMLDGELFPRISVVYNSSLYNGETVNRFKNLILKSACRLAEYAAKSDVGIVSLIESI